MINFCTAYLENNDKRFILEEQKLQKKFF